MASHVMVYCHGNGAIYKYSTGQHRVASAWEQPPATGRLRWPELEELDNELGKGNERAALNIVKLLKEKPGGLRGFGSARQIPQRLYTLDELKLNGIETVSLLSPVDTTLGSIERIMQAATLVGGIAAWNVFELNPQQILFLSLGLLFLWTLDGILSTGIPLVLYKVAGMTSPNDVSSYMIYVNHGHPLVFYVAAVMYACILFYEVYFNGGVSFLVLDTLGHLFSQKYHNRVVQHEAGHFLIAYLLGILPRGYTLTSLEALKKEGSLNVQAGTAFVDFEFLEEVNKGKVSATTLDKFSCIALAGLATEYLLFGCSEGGLADINTLDKLLKSLGFTQKKSDGQVRWAVLNTVLTLRRHEKARSVLANAMSQGRSVGYCIDIIEKTIDDDI